MPRQFTCLCCGTAFAGKGSADHKFCSRECRDSRVPRPIEHSDDGLTALVPLIGRDGSVRAVALIDAEDAAWANRWRWSLSRFYAARIERVNGIKRSVSLHRSLMGLTVGDGLDVDHINRDKLDNRRTNLRIIPRGMQPQNAPPRKSGTSKYRGVHWASRDKRWMATVIANGKSHYCGSFINEEDAAVAAQIARARLQPYATD